MRKLTVAFVPVLLFTVFYPVFCRAYGTSTDQEINSGTMIGRTGEHEAFVQEAYEELCAAKRDDAFCDILHKNLRYMQFGAYMEDAAWPGYNQTFDKVVFTDAEEDQKIYENCSFSDTATTPHPYCNHFLFIIRKPGEAMHSCGSWASDATKGCSSGGGTQWKSADERGDILYKRALSHIMPNKNSQEARENTAYMFFWLGRVAHLLADMGVPGHVISHPINYLEVEHRVYEYRVSFNIKKRDYANPPSSIFVNARSPKGLFYGLAKYTIGTDDAIRENYPVAHPLQAAVSVPAEGDSYANSVRAKTSTLSLLASGESLLSATKIASVLFPIPEPERPRIQKAMDEDSRIAAEVCRNVKPAVVAYTVRLLEIFRDEPQVKKQVKVMEAINADPGGFYAVKKDPGSYQAAPVKSMPAWNSRGEVIDTEAPGW